MRKVLGPFAGVVFNKQGHLACPEPIIKMRAALAATKPVKGLRPQALPVKFLAMGVVTALLNVPCGMWREHTEKFSTGWFIAVHATIPFIAMLRKAVIMPKCVAALGAAGEGDQRVRAENAVDVAGCAAGVVSAQQHALFVPCAKRRSASTC